MAYIEITKSEIAEQAREFGAELIGFAPVKRWEEYKDVPAEFYPRTIWPQAKTAIVMGVPLWLPIVEAAPSVLGREQMIVTGKLLEKAAFRLVVLLNRAGYRAVSVPWNSRGETVETPTVFSNAWAGYYAGLGTVGRNHALLTREYGPRLQLKSVLTDLEVAGDPLVDGALCTRCLHCQTICPAQALGGDANTPQAVLNQEACLHYEKKLQKAFCDPCGACIKVCPVGEDRQLFQSHDFKKYFEEKDILAQNPKAKAYKDWVHIRSYGSFPLEDK